MNKNSNKIRFYPRTSKQTKNSNIIPPQETKTEKSNLFTQNNNSNSNFKLPEPIHQTNKEIEKSETYNNNEMFVLDNNNQTIKNQQNDDINLKRLITSNDAENITFINTLLKLKQKIIQNKKANGNNNNISRHNESSTNIEDNNNLSNIKEYKIPKENINPKQIQLQVNDNLISSLQTHNLINKKNSNHNFVFSDPLKKGENQLSYVQNNSFGNSFTNYGVSPNTTVANYNKYSGLKTKDLIEITNRRKMMTESNLDSHVKKKGFDEIKNESIKNDMDYKKFVFKPFTSQINSKPNQMTNNNNQDLNIIKTNKEISNEITQQETNNIYSNKNEAKFSPSFNNTNQFTNMINSNPLSQRYNNDNAEFIQDSNKGDNFNNINSNRIPVEERLFYSTEELEQEALMILQQRKNNPIKINLKEIKAEVQRKQEMSDLNHQITENITSINSHYFPLTTKNNCNSPNFENPFNTIHKNNDESLEDIIQSHLQNSKPSVQNDYNKYTNNNTFSYASNNTNNELKDENYSVPYKHKETQQINQNINKQTLSDFNLSGLNNYINSKSNNFNVTSNKEPTQKYFTPKLSYYGDLLKQDQNNFNMNNLHNETEEQMANTQNENEKFDLNKIHLLLTDKEKLNTNNFPKINETEKAKSENILKSKIELFNDNDEDEEEDIPEKISPSKIQQNSIPIIQANQYSKSSYNFNKQIPKKPKLLSKNFYNPIEPIQENSNEVDVDDLVEPFQTSQTNSPKQTQAPTKQLTKSFCLSNPSSNEKNNQNDNKDLLNKLQFSTNNHSNTNIINEEHSSTQKKHCKSKTNNFKNQNENRKPSIEEKKLKRIPNTTRHSNIKKKNNENISGISNKPKNTNPSFDNYFKNIFSQEQHTKSFNSSINKNKTNNNKLSNSVNQGTNKTIKSHVLLNSSENHEDELFTQDEELLSIINSSEHMAEAIINQSFQKDIINKHKNKNIGSSSSYMVSNDVKEQLRVQFENQNTSKGKINSKIKNKGI